MSDGSLLQEASSQNTKKYKIKDIPPDHFFTKPVFLDEKFILTVPEMPFTGTMIKTLEDWEFDEVSSAGVPTEKMVANGLSSSLDWDALADATLTNADKMILAEEFFAELIKYVETLFTQVAQENKLNYPSLNARTKIICDIIRKDRRLLLMLQKHDLSSLRYNYLASHSVKSTIISIIIGLRLMLPEQRLIELGVAALLHEVGMVRLPAQLFTSNRPLLPVEQNAVRAHPVLGYNLLRASDFPLSVSLAALEHHERENGSGYPRMLLGNKISLYAKIIAVACSYEALSAQRPHKEAKDGHTGILELLKNEGKLYDSTVVRALVYSLSIYPVGLYVLLSNGRTGQVVDVNPETPRYPFVQILGRITHDDEKIIKTSQDGISIIRPLKKEEVEQELTGSS